MLRNEHGSPKHLETMSLFAELRRRNIFRVALLYAAAAWLILEIGSLCVDYANLPEWIYRFTFAMLIIGFPLALVLSWIYEITPEGLKREFEVDLSDSITTKTGQVLLKLAFLAVLLVVLLNLARFALD